MPENGTRDRAGVGSLGKSFSERFNAPCRRTGGSIMAAYRLDQMLVFLLIVMAGAEVQENISSECKQFLYMGTLPRGLEEHPLKKICQFYAGKPRFVTLYDVFGHIPVYSAYTFKRSDGLKKVDVPWMFEPQVWLPNNLPLDLTNSE